jgi:hypothetical protein
MNSAWYNVTVVLLWVATMSWLVTRKVLPALLVGEPPTYRTIVEAQHKEPLVGWAMRLNNRPVGWALSKTSVMVNDMTEVRSLVRFDDLRLNEVTPRFLKPLVPEDISDVSLQLEAKSEFTFDPLGRLSQFVSSVGFPGMDHLAKVRGILDGTELQLSLRTGEFSTESKVVLPQKALLTDALSPQAKLPGLREGQTWNVRIYSPFRRPDNPTEVLQATVEGVKPMLWEERTVDTWLVVYRSDPGAGTASTETPRVRLWVRDDGTVLKQEANLLDSKITFVRLSDEAASAQAHRIGDWK